MSEDNLFSKLDSIFNRLKFIESKIVALDEKVELSLAIQRNHLIRIKNGEELSDEVILQGRPYNDLSPNKAFKVYSNQDLDYILLDVSSSDYQAEVKLPEAIKIPLEELEQRCWEISSRSIPILVISEQGVHSIQACELLVKKGYFNINNISGGYRFWPKPKLKAIHQSA